MHTLFNVRNRAQLAREPNFTNRDGSMWQRAVEKRARHRKRNREIGGGLRDFEAAKRLREDILIRES